MEVRTRNVNFLKSTRRFKGKWCEFITFQKTFFCYVLFFYA